MSLCCSEASAQPDLIQPPNSGTCWQDDLYQNTPIFQYFHCSLEILPPLRAFKLMFALDFREIKAIVLCSRVDFLMLPKYTATNRLFTQMCEHRTPFNWKEQIWIISLLQMKYHKHGYITLSKKKMQLLWRGEKGKSKTEIITLSASWSYSNGAVFRGAQMLKFSSDKLCLFPV